MEDLCDCLDDVEPNVLEGRLGVSETGSSPDLSPLGLREKNDRPPDDCLCFESEDVLVGILCTPSTVSSPALHPQGCVSALLDRARALLCLWLLFPTRICRLLSRAIQFGAAVPGGLMRPGAMIEDQDKTLYAAVYTPPCNREVKLACGHSLSYAEMLLLVVSLVVCSACGSLSGGPFPHLLPLDFNGRSRYCPLSKTTHLAIICIQLSLVAADLRSHFLPDLKRCPRKHR